MNRTPVQITWDFSDDGPNFTRVGFELRTEPAGRLAKITESLGARGYSKRQWKTALERLRMIFEERPEGELARATVAAYEPRTAPRYG